MTMIASILLKHSLTHPPIHSQNKMLEKNTRKLMLIFMHSDKLTGFVQPLTTPQTPPHPPKKTKHKKTQQQTNPKTNKKTQTNKQPNSFRTPKNRMISK